jgi:hypothetical protein
MMGICGCVCPPTTPGARCNACDYVVPQPYGWDWRSYQPTPLTEDDIRRIIREELARITPPQGASRNE